MGATIVSAGAAGLFIQANGNLILAFSMTGGYIPAGCGTLVNLNLTGEATGLSGIVVSDTAGSQLYFEYYIGSDDPDLVYDCTDEYPDCAENYYDCSGECGGSAEVDECGVCGGDGIPAGECDCEGNVDLGCGCGEAGPSGCDNACGSSLGIDECGICGGDNIGGYLVDCDGECIDYMYYAWVGDGWCDEGAWGITLNCEALDCDGGDCPDSWCGCMAGDTNDDGTTDIIDIVLIIGCILDDDSFCNCSDVNHDGQINVLDIIMIVDIIINS